MTATLVHAVRARPASTTRPGPAAATSTTAGCSTGLARSAAGRCASMPVAGGWPRPDAAALDGLGAAAGDDPGRGAWSWSTGWSPSAAPRGAPGCGRPAAPRGARAHAARAPPTPGRRRKASAAARRRGDRHQRLDPRWLLEPVRRWRRRVHVAEPGVDPADPAPGTAAGGRSCSASPRSTPGKGHDLLFEALAALADLAWRCTCVGALDGRPGLRRGCRPRSRRAAWGAGSASPVRGPAPTSARRTPRPTCWCCPPGRRRYGMVVIEALARGLPGHRDRGRRGARGARARHRSARARACSCRPRTRRAGRRPARLARPTRVCATTCARRRDAAAPPCAGGTRPSTTSRPSSIGWPRPYRPDRARPDGRPVVSGRRLRRRTPCRRPLRLAGGALVLAALVWRLGTGPFLAGAGGVDARRWSRPPLHRRGDHAVRAWRWRLVARGLGARRPLRAAVAAYYRSQFLNATLPGGVLGDVAPGVRHGRAPATSARGLRAVGWERRRPGRAGRPRAGRRCWSCPRRSGSRRWSRSSLAGARGRAGLAGRLGRTRRRAAGSCGAATSRGAARRRRWPRSVAVSVRRGGARRDLPGRRPRPRRRPRRRCVLVPLALIVLVALGGPDQRGRLGSARGRRRLGVRARPGSGPRPGVDASASCSACWRSSPTAARAGRAAAPMLVVRRRRSAPTGGAARPEEAPMADRPYTLLSCSMSIDGYLDGAAESRLLLSNDADFDRVDAVRAGVRRDPGRRRDRPQRQPAAAGPRPGAPAAPRRRPRPADHRRSR